MPELLRAFTKRKPQFLNQNSINCFGIQTHPENYQSTRFIHWQTLCRNNNVAALKADMTRFLQSGDSIKKVDDLGKEWAYIIPNFFAIGKEINNKKALEIIKESKIEPLFGKQRAVFINQFTAIADTTLSLAYLKHLGHRDNIDYLSAILVMAFTARSFDFNKQLPEIKISRYFDKRILLPSCFFRVDPCGEIIASDVPFPYLKDVDSQGIRENVAKGCVSGNCECHVNDECVKQSKCCAKPRIDLIDLMVVRDHTKCYLAGDLSFIKNVLEGEILSTKHRRLERTEETIESEEDIRQFEERYLQTEEKASLQKEAESVLKQDKAFDAGLTTNSHFGVNIKAFDISGGTNSTTNISASDSKTLTNKEVRDYSKDVIDRATKQVEEKVRKFFSTKKLFETEERNKHRFDNSEGGNVNGQYLYVNKISRAQVYNYGKKAVLDLILPEPAALYRRLWENKFPQAEPVKPTPIEIDPKTITPENYGSLILQYGLKDVPKPPDLRKELYIHFDGGRGVEERHVVKGSITYIGCGSEGNNAEVTVPQDYVMESMSTDFGGVLFNSHNVVNCILELKIGSDVIFRNGDDGSGPSSTGTQPYEGTNTIQLYGNNVSEFHIDLKVTFKIKPEKLLEWQMEVYGKIKEINDKAQEAYEKALADYKKEKEEFDAKEEALKKERCNKNPFINRETEKAELKRMVISYISCQFFDQFDAMKNRVEPCGFPEMNIKEAEEEGKFVQFFEQAFSWNLMTYIFYPYFWGKKCSWRDAIKEESGDLIFEKFLQAGSCHVLVPIRDGFFDYMSYFLLTGEIWGGTGTTPLPSDPHYVALAQEIKEQKENFNTEREGSADVTNGSNTVTINNTDYYWDISSNALNTANIDADIDREILLDFTVYRIVDIQPNPAVTTNDSWIITIDRNYEGVTQTSLKWSTGAVFVGAPWEFVTPTTLTFLRDKSACLPCYPLKECEEL